MEFVTPPPTHHGRRSHKWDDIVKQLKDKPGEFALVGNYSPGVPVHIRSGKYSAFMPKDFQGDPKQYMKDHWEVTTRVSETNRLDVYVRWIA